MISRPQQLILGSHVLVPIAGTLPYDCREKHRKGLFSIVIEDVGEPVRLHIIDQTVLMAVMLPLQYLAISVD